MIAFRDVLIFAGLVALAAAVIASLFPAGEGVSAVPACSDCAFKLTGGYWIRQYDNYAALYLGTREAARYGWAYVDGRPLRIGENVTCDPMYMYVLSGLAYVSCSGDTPAFRRWAQPVAGRSGVNISANPLEPGCTYTVNVVTNTSIVKLEVYEVWGPFSYSASDIPPALFTFNVPNVGAYHMHIYAPPPLNEWYTLYAAVRINGTSNVGVFKVSNADYNDPSHISLKIVNLTLYWLVGYDSVLVRLNGEPSDCGSVRISAPTTAFFADYLLAWEEYSVFTYCPFNDEVWRLTFTPSGPVLTRIHSGGYSWHEVYADGQLIFVYRKNGPKNDIYVGFDPTITVRFVSPDSKATAEATFTKVCEWWRGRRGWYWWWEWW